jgi:hypothetical protein
VWDGNDMVAEFDGNNNQVTAYTWGPTGNLIAATDYTQTTPKTYVVVSDVSGNIDELIDPTNGTVAADYHYDAWGELESAGGPAVIVCNFRGKGYYAIAQLEDQMFPPHPTGNGPIRVFDTLTHQFKQPDPTDPQIAGANDHEDVNNDPVNIVDSNGDAGESVVAAEGRVKGAAIEEFYEARGALPQRPIIRTVNGVPVNGRADLRFGNIYSEIGPASATGVQDKVTQLGQIASAQRGDLFLYKQSNAIPGVSSKVEYIKLKYAQGQQLANEIKAGTTVGDNIWTRATQLAGPEGVLSTTVSDSAAAYAGRVYLRGELMVLDYASGATAGGVAAADAAAEAQAGKALIGGLGGALGIGLTILTMPNTASAAEIDPLHDFKPSDVLRVQVRTWVQAEKTNLAANWGDIFGAVGYIATHWNTEHTEDGQHAVVLLTREELAQVLGMNGRPLSSSSIWYDRRQIVRYDWVEKATPEEIAAWKVAQK